MRYQPNFDANSPKTKEEKLIVELSNDLFEVQKAFIILNRNNCADHELFIIIRDASLNFSGKSIKALLAMLVANDQKLPFLKECKEIFDCYIKEAEKEIKK